MGQRTSSLTVDMRPGECLAVAGDVKFELVQKSGRNARVRITAPRDAVIEKKSVDERGHVPSMPNFQPS